VARPAAEALPERHPDDVFGAVVPVQLASLPSDHLAADAGRDVRRVALARMSTWDWARAIPSRASAWRAAFMLGDEAEAERRLREAAETTLDRPTVVGSALAHLAVIEIEHDREEATSLAHRASDRRRLHPAPPSNLVLAVNVLVDTTTVGARRSTPTGTAAAGCSPVSCTSSRG
jgi:hypothetical protein